MTTRTSSLRPTTLKLLLGAALVLTGCSAIIGVNDIFLDPNAGTGPEGGTPETSTIDASASETGSEGGACTGDRQTDKANCGRCGHDCLGGDCKAGVCQVIPLVGSLAAPTYLAVDDANVYMALSGNDTVVRISKVGGKLDTLVTGWQNVVGVGVAGTTLLWTSDGTLGDAGDGNFGGVWRCTLPACTDRARLSTVGDTRHLDVKDGYVYYAGADAVRRVKIDGSGDQALVSGVTNGFALAADNTNVYWNSGRNSLYRVPIAGGAEEAVGPLTGNVVGFVAVDSQRFFWAYSEASNKGQVFGALKSNSATRTSFGDSNISSVGVASDGTNVYWSNDGTTTGNDSNGDGEMLTCPVSGCVGAPLRLADKMHFGGPIVVDGAAVYFLEFGGRGGANGRLLKIAKP